MSELTLNLGPKEHALLPKPIGKNDGQAEAQAEVKAVASQEPIRESNVKLDLVDKKGSKEKECQISYQDKAIITTVYLPESVRASAPASPVLDLRKNLKEKFLGTFERTYADCFSHNRLVAKVAEWMVGNVMERLALLGMGPQEIGEMKDRVRSNLIEQNQGAIEQVVYDEGMLEIVG